MKNSPRPAKPYRPAQQHKRLLYRKNVWALSIWIVFLTCLSASQISWAQVGGPHQNTTQRNINSSATCNGGSFTRTITVPAANDFIIGDLDVGFLATHSWRGDIRLDLQSPSGTSVRLINSDTSSSGSANNVNVYMDDDAGTVIYNAPHNTNDGTSAPPFENLVSPHNPLSAFDGQMSAGVWTLSICDDYPQADDGRFRRAELFFTAVTGSDLSLAINASALSPVAGTQTNISFDLSHTGVDPASNISTQINLPNGLTYVGQSGDGTYNAATGLWTLPGNLSNQTASLQITALVGLTGPYTIDAEIQTATPQDIDSTPANNIATEDDQDSVTLTPIIPAIPVMTCPGAPQVLDWDSENWPTASLSNSYLINGHSITMTVVDPDNTLLSDNNFGGQTPALAIYDTGGLSPAQTGLHFLRNPPNRTSSTTINMALGLPNIGVSKIRFSIFDVDFGNNQFQDRIQITGSLAGTPVPVSLYTNASNSSSGNTVLGNQPAGPTQSIGNMTVDISAPIDSLSIEYGNGNNAPNNPGRQGISLHDVSFCPNIKADISALKTAAIYDPLSEGLYMVPGNDVVYTLTFINEGTGPTDANSVVLIDAMPDEIEFYNGDMDDNGPITTPVSIIDQSSGLTFNYGNDVRYATGSTQPSSFTDCTYSPVAGYDPNVNYICLNPKGAMAFGSPDPSFAFLFRARIR